MTEMLTLAGLRTRYTELKLQQLASDRVSGALDMAKINLAIADAVAEVSTYLEGRVAMPLSAVPEIITRLAADIAWYRLHGETVPEAVQKRYDAARDMLKSFASGKVTLGLDIQGNKPAPAAQGAQMVSGGRVWDRQDSKGFI